MNRPYLVNFSAIISNGKISIRANITDSNYQLRKIKDKSSAPIESISLFTKHLFRIKIIGLSSHNSTLSEKEYESDNYGNIDLQLAHRVNDQDICKILVYETAYYPGVDIHLGSFLPLIIKEPKKILISDFDKTLVDTKYSTPTELYHSLNKPLNYFPTVDKTLEIVHDYINKDFQPFILSASPHFYENAIRDWLYQNKIFASNIFLKDYRDFISIFDGSLATKDLKKHGFYKINQLVDILMMVGIPDHLVLFGDGFETDDFIYLIMKSLLVDKTDPWKLWDSLKNHRIFNLNSKQDSYFLTKFYRLSELSKSHAPIKLEIYIRAIEGNIEELKHKKFTNKYIVDMASDVNYYIA
jgi:hypothetical protein